VTSKSYLEYTCVLHWYHITCVDFNICLLEPKPCGDNKLQGFLV
jgi:hypothetical protein